MARITDVGLPLAAHWYWIPSAGQGAEGWAAEMATRLLPEEVRNPTAIEALTERLQSVYDSVADTGFPGVRTAVYVVPPWHGLVLGMMCLRVSETASLDAYSAELADWTAGDERTVFKSAEPIETTIPAGQVLGVHAMLVHPQVDEFGNRTEVLEERVVLGVAAPGADQIVEVIGIAASLGSFKDMTQSYLDLLRPMVIENGESHG